MTLRVGDIVRVLIGQAEVLKFHPPGCRCCSATPQGRWELALMLTNGVKEPFDIPVGPELQLEHAPVRPTPGEVWVATDGARLLAVDDTDEDDADQRVVLIAQHGTSYTPAQALNTFGVLQLALPAPDRSPVVDDRPSPWRTDPYVTEAADAATPIADSVPVPVIPPSSALPDPATAPSRAEAATALLPVIDVRAAGRVPVRRDQGGAR